MVKCKMFSYNRSRHVYWNFHRSSINMAKYKTFSYNRSRHVHGIFHRSASNLVKCDMIIYRFWFRYLYGNSADIFVKFSAKSLSNVYILFSISKACIYFSIYFLKMNSYLKYIEKVAGISSTVERFLLTIKLSFLPYC